MSNEQLKFAPKKAKIQSTISGINAAENNNECHTKRMRARVL